MLRPNRSLAIPKIKFPKLKVEGLEVKSNEISKAQSQSLAIVLQKASVKF